jgi:hypothetical protein
LKGTGASYSSCLPRTLGAPPPGSPCAYKTASQCLSHASARRLPRCIIHFTMNPDAAAHCEPERGQYPKLALMHPQKWIVPRLACAAFLLCAQPDPWVRDAVDHQALLSWWYPRLTRFPSGNRLGSGRCARNDPLQTSNRSPQSHPASYLRNFCAPGLTAMQTLCLSNVQCPWAPSSKRGGSRCLPMCYGTYPRLRIRRALDRYASCDEAQSVHERARSFHLSVTIRLRAETHLLAKCDLRGVHECVMPHAPRGALDSVLGQSAAGSRHQRNRHRSIQLGKAVNVKALAPTRSLLSGLECDPYPQTWTTPLSSVSGGSAAPCVALDRRRALRRHGLVCASEVRGVRFTATLRRLVIHCLGPRRRDDGSLASH